MKEREQPGRSGLGVEHAAGPISCTSTSPEVLDIIDGFLRGEPRAMRQFVAMLEPVVFARIRRILSLHGGGRHVRREEADEIAQEVWVRLLADDARSLRNFRPERGMGLLGYVGMITERSVISILRAGRHEARRAHFGEEDDADPTEALPDEEACPESRYASQELGRHVLSALRATLSEKGLQVLELSIVEGRPIEQIRAALGMTEEAVYAWRSRILKRAATILGDLNDESAED